MLLAFWIVIPLAIVALFCGFKFSMSGPDLGTEKINNVMNKASDVAENIKSELKNNNQTDKK